MRTLKFRIWDPSEKKMHYPDPDSYERHFLIDPSDGEVYDGNGNPYDEILVANEFTGYTDKNDNDIYEGDIFKGSTYFWDEVEFSDGRFCVNLRGARVYDLDELFGEGYDPEVIGNIYENPELLDLQTNQNNIQ